MTLIAETYGTPAAMSVPLRDTVYSIDRNMPIFGVRTMDDLFDQRSVKIANMFGGIVAVLGAMGLLLALVGLYAVVSYQVGRRTREIGIRIALGAARRQVLAMVLKNAAMMAVTGVAIGGVLNLASRRALSRGLLGSVITPVDPALFVAIVVALLGTTLLAAIIPARNASRIDPQRALRQE
jgi:ABC-type antimicrobial peptide transport system permease subunit